MIEVPSHLTELYLKDYNFVSRFATLPGENGTHQPIDKALFNKLIFCDEAFRFLNLEETLYFTALDHELNTFTKGETIDERTLLDINAKHLINSFSCNVKGVRSESRIPSRPSDEELNKLIDETLNNTSEINSAYD